MNLPTKPEEKKNENKNFLATPLNQKEKNMKARAKKKETLLK